MNSLSQRLQHLLNQHTSNHKFFSLSELLDSFGSNSFGILFLFISMPSAMPFPAPGISTPFGLFNAFLAIQLLLHRPTPWLPKKALNSKFKPKTTKRMLAFSISALKKIEHLIHPRLPFFCNHTLIASLILILSLIMALPIPLTNSLPALIIFILAISIIENDGLFALLGSIAATITIALYAASAYIIFYYGIDTLIHIKNFIFNFFLPNS